MVNQTTPSPTTTTRQATIEWKITLKFLTVWLVQAGSMFPPSSMSMSDQFSLSTAAQELVRIRILKLRKRPVEAEESDKCET